MKKTLIIALFSLMSAWETVSVGFLNDTNGSATFISKNTVWGLDVQTLGIDLDIYDTQMILGQYGWYEVPNNRSASISLCLVSGRIGYRSILTTSNRIKSYLQPEAYVTIPFIDIDVDDNEDTAEVEDAAEEIVNFYGFKFIYGIEYAINEQLSFSTDIGFNWMINNIDIGDIDLQTRIGNSFTKFSINYTF